MNILQQIKDASLEARKARETQKARFLSTLLSYCSMPGKNSLRESTDIEVITILKKFKANANVIIEAAMSRNSANAQTIIDDAKLEIQIIDSFMPKTMDESDLRLFIGKLVYELKLDIVTAKHIGVIMSLIKQRSTELVSGEMATKIIKEYFEPKQDNLL